MTHARLCSECGNSLADRGARAITCGDECRQARSRRLKGLSKKDSPLVQKEVQKSINRIAHGEQSDAIRDAVRKELGPIVRQAITEDTLRAISDLVALTPLAVAALQDDLLGDDRVVRQRAYQTAMRYTVGHQAIVTADDTKEQSQMVVNFHLPRPEPSVQQIELPDGEVVEIETLQECDMCHDEKPVTEFETGSTRCTQCFDAWKAEILSKYS